MSFLNLFSFPFGSVLLVLVCAEVLRAGPVLDVHVGFKEHDEVSRDRRPGFMESSQESSGFFSEDSEDGKSTQIKTKDSGIDLSAVNGE